LLKLADAQVAERPRVVDKLLLDRVAHPRARRGQEEAPDAAVAQAPGGPGGAMLAGNDLAGRACSISSVVSILFVLAGS
jgi:hypothetical protein